MFDERLKEVKLETTAHLNTIDQHAMKNVKRIEKLQAHHLSNFISQSYFGNDGSQNFLMS